MKEIQTQMIKKFLGLCGLIVLVHSAQAQFTFPVYEPFSEYPEGDRIGKGDASSGVNWTIGNSLSATASPQVSATNVLGYPGLIPDSGSPAEGITGQVGTSGRTAVAPFTAQITNTVYSSFLLKLLSYPAGNRPFFGLNGIGGSTPSPSSGVAVWVNTSGQLQISKNNATAPATNTTIPLTLGSTYFVVIAYKFQTGPDEINLWLNPTSLGDNANVPSPTISSTNNADSASLGFLSLYYPTASLFAMTNLMDELRVHTNWAGVTPAGPSPGPIFGVTLTGSGSGCPGDAFPVGVSGSVITNDYYLYTNSVFSGQIVNGNGSATNFGPQSATAIYTVVASNTVTGALGWLSNSVSITVLASPNITTQPNPVTVATNGLALFSVVASGTGLNYQWYKNGTGLTDGGHVSGSTTPTLTIVPATTADQATAAAGYYVIITNQCGFTAISTTNSLTLDAPANIVWQGGNPNTNWDLGTTPNWTNSAGSPVVFNAGDNVTFDDTSTNQVVALVGNGLAPTLITVNANQNYLFNGSGISGPGALIKNGSGVFSNFTANTYSGGTIINAGTFLVRDTAQLSLGRGPVTLAGGTLETSVSGAANVGISNNINVTASSTFQYDGTSSFGGVIFGSVTGSPSATLTIQHNVATAGASNDRLRLYGEFTNNLPIVINPCNLGNEMEFSAYNTNMQVFNGVISGTGGRLVPRGAGFVVFNGLNTLNDSSVLANGNGASGYSILLSSSHVGLGIDSVSASPPTIDAGPVGTGNIGIQVGAEGGTDTLFASGGAHTVGNAVIYTSATNSVTLSFIGSNPLTLSGAFTLSGADNSGNTNRTLNVTNGMLATLSGVVNDAGLGCGLIKTGTGTLVLSGTDTFTGPTLVSAGNLWVNGQIDVGAVTVTNGSLGGTGTILGAVSDSAAGAIAPGTTAAIGTLTINNNLALAGDGLFKVNKSLAQSNDLAAVSGTLANSGTGTITVTNQGPALVVGDTFTLFSKPVAGGLGWTVTGAGVIWTNLLATDGSIKVLSVGVVTANYPTNITFSFNGSTTLAVGWPETHRGWILQTETNSLTVGYNTNSFTDVSGTSTATNASITVNPANPAVFIRLRHP